MKLRETLFAETNGMYPELITRPDIKVTQSTQRHTYHRHTELWREKSVLLQQKEQQAVIPTSTLHKATLKPPPLSCALCRSFCLRSVGAPSTSSETPRRSPTSQCRSPHAYTTSATVSKQTTQAHPHTQGCIHDREPSVMGTGLYLQTGGSSF
jgi:hypothetical protein